MLIKLEAARAIAAVLDAAIPELTGRCDAAHADEEEQADFPSLRVIPRRFTFQASDEEIIELDDATLWDKALCNIGDFEGQFEIRIYSEYAHKRAELEAKVLEVFFANEGAPGLFAKTAPVKLRGEQTLYEAPVAVHLDSTEWDEELVFAKKRYSFLLADAQFPALALRDEVTTDILISEIATDLAEDAPLEQVRITEEGELKPY